jgi:hypothetical protein
MRHAWGFVQNTVREHVSWEYAMIWPGFFENNWMLLLGVTSETSSDQRSPTSNMLETMKDFIT